MLNCSHRNIKSVAFPDFRLLIVWGGFVCLLTAPGAFAAGAGGFDLGEASTGFGPDNVSNTGRTNVQFSDFGYGTKFETPSLNPQYNASKGPTDSLPINQVNTVDGMNINSVRAQDVYALSGDQSGTSYNQAPRIDAGQAGRGGNPYMTGVGSSATLNSPLPANTLLPPTSTAIQAGMTPAGQQITSLPGPDTGKHAPAANKMHFTYGFNANPITEFYNGSYSHFSNIAPVGTGFRLPAKLPSTSMGSCLEINQDISPWTGK